MISDRSLKLFHKMVAEVPAYKAFLNTNGLKPGSVKDMAQFETIPISTKKNYLQASKPHELLWPKSLTSPLWYCATSGSTGEPYYFPRDDELAARGAEFAEAFLKYGSKGQGKTLVLMAFGMGVWIGGIITLRSFEIAAQRMNAPVSFLPTGYNKEQIFKALLKLAPGFDQTILVGYPPFVKEVIDEAPDMGIDLKGLNLRLMFAAEEFTETFRNYVAERAGITNTLLDTLNIYGSADLGAMAYETTLSILVR
jgi:phenylacetate-CoA ligase